MLFCTDLSHSTKLRDVASINFTRITVFWLLDLFGSVAGPIGMPLFSKPSKIATENLKFM